MTIGDIIRNDREGHGWTVYRLAKESGVSAIALHRVEAGEATLTLANWLRVARALGLPLGALDKVGA